MDIEAMKEELTEDRAALEAERVELCGDRASIDKRLKEIGGELRANKRLLLATSPRPRPVKPVAEQVIEVVKVTQEEAAALLDEAG
jgi:hypothetical protein